MTAFTLRRRLQFLADIKKNGPVHAAWSALCEKNWREPLRFVLNNCSVNARGEDQRTILMIATNMSNLEAVKILVEERKADVNLTDSFGQKAFHMTTSQEIQIYLLKHGTEVHNAMLLFACMSNHLEVARTMLELGHDANFKTSQGDTPLKNSRSTEMNALLTAYGAVH